MLPDFQNQPRRDTYAYRAFRARIMAERPICEHCNVAPSKVLAHMLQPLMGGELMDEANVRALCKPCDRLYTRSNPVLRRRPLKRKLR